MFNEMIKKKYEKLYHNYSIVCSFLGVGPMGMVKLTKDNYEETIEKYLRHTESLTIRYERQKEAIDKCNALLDNALKEQSNLMSVYGVKDV